MRAWPLAVALAACGGHGLHQPDGTTAGSDDSGIDAPLPPGWSALISRSWNLDFGGDEGYQCRRIKTTEDMYISAFRADMGPGGTHHLFLTLDPNGGTFTGNEKCDQTTGVDNGQLIFGASIGPQNATDLAFPAGDAVFVPAGSYLMLNLHVVDETDHAITGSTGVLVQTVPQGEVVHELGAVFAGTQSIDVRSDGVVQMATGVCPQNNGRRSQDYHVLAVWPHMHSFGTHSHLTFTNAQNQTDVVLDSDFVFDDQKNTLLTERVMHADDNVVLACSYLVPLQTCTYPGGQCNHGTCQSDSYCHVGYGESSVGEMCYAAMYMWPIGGNSLGCVEGHTPI